jgi:hypothetical protein
MLVLLGLFALGIISAAYYTAVVKHVKKEQQAYFSHDAQDNAFLRIYSSISKSTTEKELILNIKAINEFRKTFGENEDFDQLMNKYALMEKKIIPSA